MTQKNSSKIISVVHPICYGLDVHKDMVSACIIITEPDGEETFVVQEFSTFTDNLFRLKSWLLNHGCTIVAMESTVSFDIHFFTIRNMYQHGWCLISHILGQDHCSQMRLSVSNEYVRF